MNLHEVYRNSGLGKWFHGESANKTPGWDRYNSEGKIVGECGDAKKGEAYSACLSKQKAEKLGKEGRASFVKRKRAAQSAAGRGEKGSGEKGKKPINVDTGASKMEECHECENDLILEGKNKPNDPEKWSACKSAAKSKFDVYPSAYANAWASKCYKKKGGTWRSIKEETQMDEIKQTIKENIISSFMENAKPEFAPRGASKQRPKSWDKGTKSGSEKRKMREQGKREAREMNEGWVDDESGAQERLIRSGMVSPDTSYYRGNRTGQYRPYEGQIASQTAWAQKNIHPILKKHGMEEFAARTSEHGYPAGLEVQSHPNFRAFLNDFIKIHTQHNRDFWSRENRASPYHWPAIKHAKQELEYLNRREAKANGDLSEGQSWGPEFAGSSQDDATARAYEEQGREADINSTPVSHSEMVEKIQKAHDAAIAHAYTAATMGKKKLTPEQMHDTYHEHFKRVMGSSD